MESEMSNLPDGVPMGKKFSLKVLGVGGAGGNAVSYMAQQLCDGISFVAINTDSQALNQLAIGEKLVLGSKLTRGLGTGGDPEMGRAAAQEDVEKIRGLVTGADVVCVVAGMGGGTGTGAAPVVAKLAKETGALVLGIVTLPFDFEGSRRGRQAQLGLRALKGEADGVICLPNQKVFKLIDENTSVNEALKITNEFLAQGVRGIWRLLTQTGLINVDFNDLCAVLRDRHEESSLATVEASGENRSKEILEKLIAHPFLEAGHVLSEADAVLVSLAGGPDLTMAEINRIMEQVNRQCENAHIIMGAGIQESLAGRLSVTVVASRRNDREERPSVRHGQAQSQPQAGQAESTSENSSANNCEKELSNSEVAPRPASRFVPPAPNLNSHQTEQLLSSQNSGSGRSRKKSVSLRQGQLPLEIVSKGRFEKSEPTIHQGEDLDVPTYIRRGIALN